MQTPQPVKDFLRRPMDRREFFRHVGVAGLFVVGGGLVARSIADLMGGGVQPGSQQQTMAVRSFAYGTRAYGGR